jgi:hypothetical protein
MALLVLPGIELRSDTGIDTMDAFIPGASFACIGNFQIYRLPEPVKRDGERTNELPMLTQILTDKAPDRRTKNIFLIMKRSRQALPVEEAFNKITSSFKGCDIVVCVGQITDRCVVAYIRKEDAREIPAMVFSGITTSTYGMARGNVRVQQNVLETFAGVVGNVMTNLDIVKGDGEQIAFEQLVSGTVHLSEPQLNELRGSILVKDPKCRTKHDAAVLRAFPALVQVRRDRLEAMSGGMVWSAVAPPTPVAPMRFLMNLDTTIGTRLLEQSGGEGIERFTLKQLFEDASIMNRYAVCFMGSNGTSGFGKSTVMKKLACVWSLKMNQQQRRAVQDAKVIWSNTVDDLRGLSIPPFSSICLDEFDIGDETCIQYASASLLKSLFDPSCPANLRCRARNAMLPANTARMMSTNATSVHAWGGSRIVFSEPLLRKLIVFDVQVPLVARGWSSDPSYRRGEE